MAVSYFPSRGASNSFSPLYQLKSIPLINRTNTIRELINGFGASDLVLPVWRAAAANNYFSIGSGSAVLLTSSTLGVESTISTLNFGSQLSASSCVAVHLNSTDQCLYLLLYASPNFRLIKINDTSGAVTAIGASFTVTSVDFWPTVPIANVTGSTPEASMFVDGDGHIRVYCRGRYHQINKNTGAIVSQDTSETIGGFSLINTAYLTLDKTIAVSGITQPPDFNYEFLSYTAFVAQPLGQIKGLRLNSEYVTGSRWVGHSLQFFIMVDTDKIFFAGNVNRNNTGSAATFGYVYRADYDRFLQSVADWYVGT